MLRPHNLPKIDQNLASPYITLDSPEPAPDIDLLRTSLEL